MTTLTISLPSLFPAALSRALGELAERTRSDYEVVVCAPWEVRAPRVRWVPETVPLGSSGAQAPAARHLTSDYLVAMSDDRVVVDGWDLMAIENFERRESEFNARGPFCLGLRQDIGHVGTCMPMMRCADVAMYGWYDPVYYSGWGDVDIGLRIWSEGGRVEWTEKPLAAVHPDDNNRPRSIKDADMAVFVERWAAKYGVGWSTETLPDFNVNVYPERSPELVSGNTIFHNDPGFSELVGMSSPPVLIKSGDGVNFVRFQRKVFAVPQSLGPIDLGFDDNAMRPEIVTFDTLAAAEASMNGTP